jgi:hypothetical protein
MSPLHMGDRGRAGKLLNLSRLLMSEQIDLRYMSRLSSRHLVLLALIPLLVSPPFLFSGPVTIANGTFDLGTAYNSETKIASDQSGNLFVAYSSLASNGTYFVQVAKSTDGGATWSPVPGVPAGPYSSRSAIVATKSGSLGLVWTEGVTEFSQIYFSSYKDGVWAPKVLLSNSKYYSGYPAIATDSEGGYHVVWYGFDGISYQIYYTHNSGSSWSTPFDLSALKQDSLNPSIAIDSADNIYVAWYAEVVHNYQVFYSYFSGGNWSRTIPLTVETVDSSNPSLLIQPDGEVNVVWVSTIHQYDQVFTMTGHRDSWGVKHQLTNGSVYASNPTQTFTANGTEFVFWTEGNGLYGCSYVNLCAPRVVYIEGFNSFPIAATYAVGGQSVVVMWSHSESSQLTPSSVLFARITSSAPPASTWTGILLVLVVIVVVAVYLLAGRSILRRPS